MKDVVLAEWDDPILGRQTLTMRRVVAELGRVVSSHDNLVTAICDRHEGVDYPVDAQGYAELPDDYVSALVHSGVTGDARRMLKALDR